MVPVWVCQALLWFGGHTVTHRPLGVEGCAQHDVAIACCLGTLLRTVIGDRRNSRGEANWGPVRKRPEGQGVDTKGQGKEWDAGT